MSPLQQRVLQQVEQLTPKERLEFIQQVAEGLKKDATAKPKPKWSDLLKIGSLPHDGGRYSDMGFKDSTGR